MLYDDSLLDTWGDGIDWSTATGRKSKYEQNGDNQKCPIGKYWIGGTPTLWDAGKFMPAVGFKKYGITDWLPWPLGTYWSSTGMSSPTSCLSGFYQDTPGSISCKACTSGFQWSSTGLI